MNALRTTFASRKNIPSVWESTLAQSGIPISPCCIRTTTKKHEEFGQPVCARAVPVRSVFRVRNAEGGCRWFLSRVEPLRASDGTLIYWVGVNLDNEERKRSRRI